jgi:hypothetical protein
VARGRSTSRSPLLTWDAMALDRLAPARISGRGTAALSISFVLGSEGVEMFETAMAHVRQDFPDKTVPFFESTHLGVYLPRGWDR